MHSYANYPKGQESCLKDVIILAETSIVGIIMQQCFCTKCIESHIMKSYAMLICLLVGFIINAHRI